jgi:hypothetical protein
MDFELASQHDDPDLRGLLRDNPMPGLISLSFEREPDFFLAAGLEGPLHQTVLGRDPASGRVAGLASRSARPAYVDGTVIQLGYLSQVRIDPAFRGKTVLAGGWDKMRQLHEAEPLPYYVTTIVADNTLARRVLEKDRKAKPCYRARGELYTLALVPRRRRLRSLLPGGPQIRPASAEMLPDIAACLQRNYRRYQLAPHWTAEMLAEPVLCRGLQPADFLVALRAGRVVGCLASWDQQAYKQSVVRGYGRPLRLARPLLNALSRAATVPWLPPVGASIPHAYLSHAAADGDDASVLVRLLDSALHRARAARLSYMTLGLTSANPMLGAVRRAFRHIAYRSILYVVYWPDGQRRAEALQPGIPHLEVAVL